MTVLRVVAALRSSRSKSSALTMGISSPVLVFWLGSPSRTSGRLPLLFGIVSSFYD